MKKEYVQIVVFNNLNQWKRNMYKFWEKNHY